VQTHRVALRLALAALVHSGTPPERITDLSLLLTEKNRRAIISWHFERAGRRRTDQMAAIGNVMRILGKYHVGLHGAELDELLADLKRARPPKQRHMTAKNASRLRELENPGRCAALVGLPAKLMDIAARRRDGWIDTNGVDRPAWPKRAAWLASLAGRSRCCCTARCGSPTSPACASGRTCRTSADVARDGPTSSSSPTR